MANFYKMDPAVWDATTAVLTLEEEAAYLRICNAIYKAERGCPDLPRVLAGMFRCSTRKARSLVDSLIQKGKIYRRDDALWNDKAEREIIALEKKKAKKNAETFTNRSRTDHEMVANTPRTDSELVANRARNVAEPTGKLLKILESSNGNDPPRQDKTRQDDTRKDSLKNAFEDFWKSYPRRRQESGSLSRGSKKAAFDLFSRMTVADRKLAIDGVAGFARLYPDDTKAVCDCERYLSKQRWLDVESIDEKPQEFIPYPKQKLGDKVRSLAKLITIPSYKSWFIKNGECIIFQKNEKVIIKATTSITETEIRKRFTSHLSLIFGANGYEFEIQNDLRRDAG